MGLLSTPDFWVAVSFIGFILLIVYFKVPGKVTKMLDDRADLIRQELDEARKLREEAQTRLAEYERKQRSAEKEAEGIIAGSQQQTTVML